MPAPQPPAKVLVTGANGFVALHVITQLLEKGYKVRGTVRSDAKGEWLVEYLAKFGAGSFEYAIVKDITEEGVFDNAIQGVDAVMHLAAVAKTEGTYKEIYPPAVHGTASIVGSILKYGVHLKRFILLSSWVAAFEQGKPKGYLYSDKDWCDYAVQQVKENGENTPAVFAYFAGKAEGERSAWKAFEETRGKADWDLVTFLPPYVFGPFAQDEPAWSNELVLKNVFPEKPLSEEELAKNVGFWIDVRDVAHAMVLGLQKEEASAHRFLIYGGPLFWQEVYNALQPYKSEIPNLPTGNPGLALEPDYKIDDSKAKQILGITYRALGETAKDAIISWQKVAKKA